MTSSSSLVGVLVSPRGRRVLLTAAVLVYLLEGVYLSRALVSWDDEGSYLTYAYLVVTGAISSFEDGMTGQRMPLPFYLLGTSQLIVGRNLWAARLLSLIFGLGVLGLTIAVARRLHDGLAGLLAGLFLATQGALVGYYATATYHSLTALILMAAVWVLLKDGLPWRYALGMAVASLLFLTRTNMFPALPFLLVWALRGAPTRVEKSVVVVVAAVPPVMFFLTDPAHLKLLAYVPLLKRLVEPLGYRSQLDLQGYRQSDLGHQLWSFVLFARRYESWTLLSLGVVLALIVVRAFGRPLAFPAARMETALVAGLYGWTLLWHYVIFRLNFKWVIAYFPDFAPLAAVLLGVATATLLTSVDLPRLSRGILLVGLVAGLTISVVVVRNPLLPTPLPRPFRGDPIQLMERSVARLRALVPAGSRVFLFGQSMPVYLAGLRMYVPQIMSTGTLAAGDQDPWLVARNGLWGLAEVERWLGVEAQYALISPQFLQASESDRPESVGRIRELLQQRFEFVARVDDASWYVYEVYRRREGGAGK